METDGSNASRSYDDSAGYEVAVAARQAVDGIDRVQRRLNKLDHSVRRAEVRASLYALRAAVAWLWRLMRPVVQTLWRWVEPSFKDIVGWLLHTAPRLALRLLGRLLHWAPGAAIRTLSLAAVGLWWLLVHIGRYVLAYREYGGLLREAEDENQPRRAFRIRQQWRRTSGRRLFAVAVLAVLLGVVVDQLTGRYGWRAMAVLVVMALAVLAGIGRLVRGRQARTPEEQAKAEGEPFPIADAHTRREAAECVTRALKAEGIELRGTDDAASAVGLGGPGHSPARHTRRPGRQAWGAGDHCGPSTGWAVGRAGPVPPCSGGAATRSA